jgi:DNA-binding MarR family transcriptional regulator
MSKARAVSYQTTEHVRDHCLCLQTQRTARSLARRFDAALAPLELTNGQFSLLMSLNRREPASMGDVAALLAMDRTTLTAALKPLQRRGLVKVTQDKADRRSRRLSLTRAGQASLQRALPIWRHEHAALDRLVAGKDPGDLRTALRALA